MSPTELRASIEPGLADAQAGRVIAIEDPKEFGMRNEGLLELGGKSAFARNPSVHCTVLAKRSALHRDETAAAIATALGIPPPSGRRLAEYPQC
jgi:hypothetical protein